MFQNKKSAAIGIIGLGRFGSALAIRLCELGKEVMVLDENEEKVKEMRSYTEYAFVVEHLTRKTFQDAGIQNCEVVVVCIGEKIDVSILATLNVVSLGVPKVIAKAISAEHGYVLKKIGAQVVYPEHDMALRIANRIVSHNVLDYLTLNSDVQISEMLIPASLVGSTVESAEIRKKYGFNIIAIEQGDDIIIDIEPDRVFQEGDIMVIIGKKENIRPFEAD